MLKFQIYQSQLKGTSAYGKYFARIVTDQSLDIDGLATHMADHNTPFSRGTIKGILEDAVGCIKELLLDGKRVQLNNLVSFGLGIEHAEGADTADKFSVQRNVKSVKLIAQGIGSFSKSTLTSGARLAENRSYVSPKSGGPSTEPETPGGGNTPDTENPGGEVAKYTLTLAASPSNGGTVTGAGVYDAGSEVTINAAPASGYTFKKWSDGDTNAERMVTVDGDMSLTATFEATSAGGSGDDGDGDSAY